MPLIAHVPSRVLALSVVLVTTAGAEELVVAGTGASQKMFRELATEFEKTMSDCLTVVPDSVGSRGGIRALIANKVNLARVSRALKEQEREQGLVYLPVAETRVGFVMHPSVSGVETISVEQLLGIYSGRITNWREPGGPDHPIYPLIRDGGTTLRMVVEHVPGFEPTSSAAKSTYSSLETKGLLLKHPYTVGFLPLTIAVSSGLKPLAIRAIASGEGADIDIPLALGLVHGPAVGDCAQRFFEFLSSERAVEIIEQNDSKSVAR